MTRSVSLAALIVPLVACTPKTTGDDTGSTEGGSSGTSIADIQSGAFEYDAENGTPVTVSGVIVTTAINEEGSGFFVQDAGGGEYSGMYVYLQQGLVDLYIAEGDELTISGDVVEFYDWTELVVASETSIEVTGEGEVTADTVSDASDFEAWESCLVTFEDVTIDAVNTYGEAELDVGLTMDDWFTDFSVAAGGTFDSVTGAIGYSYSTWMLFPRSEADLDGYDGEAGGGSTVATVNDVQEGGLTGTVVLENVVVTTPIANDNSFHVQDAGGGAYSGVKIYSYNEFDSLSLSPGDVVTVTGGTYEYYALTEITIEGDASVEVISTGGSPTVDSVGPASVTDQEAWEGCLVDVGGATIDGELSKYGDWPLDNGLYLHDEFISLEDLSNGTSFSNIKGIWTYDWKEWKLSPRSDSDLTP